MLVVLISHPNVDKAAAALDVSIGSLADPKDAPGIAHFLEHMLFMGSNKVNGKPLSSQWKPRLCSSIRVKMNIRNWSKEMAAIPMHSPVVITPTTTLISIPINCRKPSTCKFSSSPRENSTRQFGVSSALLNFSFLPCSLPRRLIGSSKQSIPSTRAMSSKMPGAFLNWRNPPPTLNIRIRDSQLETPNRCAQRRSSAESTFDKYFSISTRIIIQRIEWVWPYSATVSLSPATSGSHRGCSRFQNPSMNCKHWWWKASEMWVTRNWRKPRTLRIPMAKTNERYILLLKKGYLRHTLFVDYLLCGSSERKSTLDCELGHSWSSRSVLLQCKYPFLIDRILTFTSWRLFRFHSAWIVYLASDRPWRWWIVVILSEEIGSRLRAVLRREECITRFQLLHRRRRVDHRRVEWVRRRIVRSVKTVFDQINGNACCTWSINTSPCFAEKSLKNGSSTNAKWRLHFVSQRVLMIDRCLECQYDAFPISRKRTTRWFRFKSSRSNAGIVERHHSNPQTFLRLR